MHREKAMWGHKEVDICKLARPVNTLILHVQPLELWGKKQKTKRIFQLTQYFQVCLYGSIYHYFIPFYGCIT